MRRAAFWYSGVLAGVVFIIAGLIVDAWRHNGGAADESLLSMGNPGHLIAAIGLAVTAVSALIGLTLAWWEWAGWPQPDASDLLRRTMVPAGIWVGLGGLSVGAVAYIASSDISIGHGDHGESVSAVPTELTAGSEEAAVVVVQSSHDGHDDGDPSAAASEDSGHEGHDLGPHPTFDEFMTLSNAELVSRTPAGALDLDEVPILREQLREVRAAAQKYEDVEVAIAEGYYNTTHDVPFMGAHFVNVEYLADRVFAPSKPEGLLYSKLGDPDGPWQLAGVWFLELPGSDGSTVDKVPDGFAGDLDFWHGHEGLCMTGADLNTRENVSAEECKAGGGRYTADLRWMMHAWVRPEVAPNEDGVFAYLNESLFQLQARAESP